MMGYSIKAQRKNLDLFDSEIIVKERGLGRFLVDKEGRRECVAIAKGLAKDYGKIEYNCLKDSLIILRY